MEGRLIPRVAFVRLDAGAKFGVGVQIGRWRHAWRFRNPFFVYRPHG